jgi:hypothetical protein
MSQKPQTDLLDDLICLKCGAGMALKHSGEEYPGYHRRAFECPVCGNATIQWAGVPQSSAPRQDNQIDS